MFRIEPVPAAGVPETLLEKALEEKKRIARAAKRGDSFAAGDRVWIAFDRDEHHKVSQTINNAKANDVGVAFSNPCFELWLILHVKDFDKPDGRHEVQKHCESCVEGYDRKASKTCDFMALIDGIDAAESRAESLAKRRCNEGNEQGPPSTTFYELTRCLRG
jgi:hypothetical protein